MERKDYGITRSFSSAIVLLHVVIICCVLSFNIHAQPSPWMMGADSAVLIDGSPASEFDTRLNIIFSDSFTWFAITSIQLDQLFASAAPAMIAADGAPDLYGPMNLAGALGGMSIMSQVTPDLVARLFPGAPRANIEKYLPLIRKALAERGLVDKAMVLMALATMRAESARFDPISEAPSPLNTVFPGSPFNKYDRRQDLGNMGPPDGAMFKGRGFIQLTGRKNYGLYGALLGYNLTGNPELANTPQPAARILAAYLKENEPLIRSALAVGDLVTARRIVNGGLNGLDRFRAAFLIGDQLIRDYDGDFVLSKESQGRRESRKVKEVKAASTSASKGLKSKEKKRDDVADGKTKAKKRDDIADGKTKTKKRDDETDENKGTDGKSKGKGFVLFRLFRALSSLP